MSERIEKIKAFLVGNPTDSFLQHALALEFLKLGDEKEARRLFEKLLEENEQYVGSYYHLGKLLESSGENENAIACFEKGMQMAKQAGDQHSFNELKSAYDDLIY